MQKCPDESNEVQKSRERRFLAVSMESLGAGCGVWCLVFGVCVRGRERERVSNGEEKKTKKIRDGLSSLTQFFSFVYFEW